MSYKLIVYKVIVCHIIYVVMYYLTLHCVTSASRASPRSYMSISSSIQYYD